MREINIFGRYLLHHFSLNLTSLLISMLIPVKATLISQSELEIYTKQQTSMNALKIRMMNNFCGMNILSLLNVFDTQKVIHITLYWS